jgi:serine/threonine protein kinase
MTTPDADDEPTVIKAAPRRGVAPASDLLGDAADALPAGTRLHEFEIVSVIGQGGFGIVYLAHDLTLDRRVAIKEYMPSALATRTQAMTVAVRSSRHTETFAAGLRSFINEARLLAQFDHPSLLKVHRFWEGHGTAYMVMPYYAGTTFGRLLAQHDGRPDEAHLRALLGPLLDALAVLHAAQCYHRDIAPDNILILPDGRPLLLDFGAARRVIGDMTRALTVILKTGYAPVEQYGEMPDMTQGAWTDLYALGSVIQFAITGNTPPQAVARFLADKRVPLAVTEAGRYGDAFLRAIDGCLAVHPKDRPQSVAALRAMLGDAPGATLRRAADKTPEASKPPRALPARAEGSPPATTTARATAPVSAPRPGRRAIVVVGVALGLVLAAAVGGYAWFGTSNDNAPASPPAPAATTPPPEAAPAAVAAPAPAPAPEVATAPVTAQSPLLPDADRSTPAAEPAVNIQSDANKATASSSKPRATPATPVTRAAPRIPNKTLPSGRCADIIQRASLGEEPSAADKAFLQQECAR